MFFSFTRKLDASKLCLGLLLCALLTSGGGEVSAQNKKSKQKSKLEQDMERWEKPKGKIIVKAAQQSRPNPVTRVKPAPKPKPAPRVVRAPKAKAPARPAPSPPPDQAALDALPDTDPTGDYGKAQHNKLQTVTFNGTQAKVEVRVDGEAVGLVDDTLTLTAKLKPGPHTITLARPGFVQQDVSLEVKVGKNSLGLPALAPITLAARPPEPAPTPVVPAPPAPTPAPVPTPAPILTPTPAPIPSGPNSVDLLRGLDGLLQRFKDPERADKVTAQEWIDARALIVPARQRDPSNIELQARDFLAQGQIYFLQKKYFEARQNFRDGLKAMPNSAVLNYALGNTFLISNEPTQAIGYYRAALAQEQNFALAQKALGDAYSKSGATKEATAAYQRARSNGYASPELSASLGRNMMREQNWQGAVNELKAATKAPTVEIYLNLGACYEALKRIFPARDAYVDAAKLDANAAEPFYKLGELYFANNEVGAAADAYEQYLIKAPEDSASKRAGARRQADEARRRSEATK